MNRGQTLRFLAVAIPLLWIFQMVKWPETPLLNVLFAVIGATVSVGVMKLLRWIANTP